MASGFSDLRLPAIKLMWAKFAEQSDKEQRSLRAAGVSGRNLRRSHKLRS
jgi:hypothetical protein